jgi:hypothetical protein
LLPGEVERARQGGDGKGYNPLHHTGRILAEAVVFLVIAVGSRLGGVGGPTSKALTVLA